MANLKKKLVAVFLAFLAVVSLSAGVYFMRHETVTLAETEALSPEYFNIEDGVFTGLKDTGKAEGEFFTVDLSDTVITRIGPSALMNCTQLTEVIIPDSVVFIDSGAFRNCVNLKSVTFKSTANAAPYLDIRTQAFSGCSSLLEFTIPENVMMLGSGVFSNCGRLLEIYNKSTDITDEDLEGYALNVYTEEGGSKLIKEVIKEDEYTTGGEYTYYVDGETVLLVDYKGENGDPTSLNLPKDYNGKSYKIHYGTFRNHLGFKNIYLPDSNIQIAEGAFTGTSDELIVIAPDKASYNKFDIIIDDVKFAYEVKLNLVYGGADHEVKKLNIGYEYENNGDIWEYVGEEAMPVQKGYKTSVWYYDPYLTGRLDGSNINEALLLGDTTIYALAVEKPVLLGNVLTYTGTEIRPEDALLGWTEELENSCDISVTQSPSGTGIIKEQGSYLLQVSLKEMYGEWAEPLEPIAVNVGVAELDVATLQWGSLLDNNTVSPLDPTDSVVHLYIYNEASRDIPYYLPKPGVSNPTYAQVINSCLNFTDSQYTVVLVDDKDYGGEFEVTYTSNKITAAGIYEITAKITSSSNYTLVFNESDDATARGVSKVGEEGMTLTIKKKVYIVSANTNGLILGGSTYSIPSSWTYGDGAPLAPKTIYGNAEELITFTLDRSDLNANRYRSILNEGRATFTYDKFGEVINSSIPAGDYRLVITLDKFESYAGASVEFRFTVDNARFDRNVTVQNVYEKEFDSTIVQFGDFDGSDLTATPHKGRTGIWQGSEYDAYYTGFEITYRVVSQYSDSIGYFPEDYYNSNLLLAPKATGTYTIYYSISAPSIVPKTGSYLLVIYFYLYTTDIVVPEVEYSGEAQTPSFNSDFYHAIYFNTRSDEVIAAERVLGRQGTQDYINVGDYTVALVIEDKYYVDGIKNYVYRWADSTVDGYNEYRYALVPFRVHGAKTTGVPYVADWEYGSYDPAINIISYETNRDDYYPIKQDGPVPEFYLQLLSGGELYPSEKFGSLGVGLYKLIVKFESSDNFDGGELVYSPLSIKAADVSASTNWSTVPEIANWKYGDFNKMFSKPNPELKGSFSAEIKNEIINGAYFLKEGSSAKYTSIEAILDSSGELPAGKYTLVYPHPASPNFANKDYLVEFEVLQADNSWKTTPIILSAPYGQIEGTFKPACDVTFGNPDDVVITYRIGSGAWSPLTAMADADGFIRVGEYEMRAVMPGTSDYEELTFNWTFEITKGQNSWKKVPNVTSWNEGRFTSIEDVFTIDPAFGTVLVTIKDNGGNVLIERGRLDELNIGRLNRLSAGKYVLEAFVEGDENYDDLSATINFVISEDNVSQTVIMALTITFAAIAIALAVVAVVLFVRRDKKMEKEFLEMVKTELRRK